MNTFEPESSPREPTEAGTFPPMRSLAHAEKVAPPESTVDYRNHNLVAAIFPNRENAVQAVEALQQESYYAPTAIGLSATAPDSTVTRRLMKTGLIGAVVGGGLAALTHRPQASLDSTVRRIGLGFLVGGVVGALVGFRQGRRDQQRAEAEGVLVKVRSGDLSESASILQQHRGLLKTQSGTPINVLHAQT